MSHRWAIRLPITRSADCAISRYTLAIFFLALWTLACGVVQRRPLTLSIVGTNDLHGGILEADGRGGLALLDGYVRNLRAARQRDGGAVLLLDAGDLFQGTLESNLSEGAVVIAAYNAMHYDAAAIGNHEFDFGPVGPQTYPQAPGDDPVGALKARLSEAHFPFVAANIIDKGSGRPIAWPNAPPSTLLTVGGVQIGVVGLTTTATLGATLTANTKGLDVAPLAAALEGEARRLRSAGATVVIATAHAGGRCTRFDNPDDLSSCVGDSEIFTVARALPSGLVDAIVAGHRHEGIAHDVAGIPIISSYSGGRAFGRVDLSVDRRSGKVIAHHLFAPHEVCAREDPATEECTRNGGVPAHYEGAPVTASSEIEQILAPAIAAAADRKKKPLTATIAETLPHVEDESASGNLLADWARLAAGTDIAIGNTGGVRSAVPAGPLTYGRLFELTPFDNREARLTLTGADLRLVVRKNLERRGDMITLSGVKATATCGKAGLAVALTRASGRPVRDRDLLTVTTSDFLATGGSDILSPVMPFRAGARMDGPIIRDEMADWLVQHGGTWRARDLFGPDHRRLTFDGKRPVQCGGGQ